MGRREAFRKFLLEVIDARVEEKAKCAAQAGDPDVRIANRLIQYVWMEVRIVIGIVTSRLDSDDAEAEAKWKKEGLPPESKS